MFVMKWLFAFHGPIYWSCTVYLFCIFYIAVAFSIQCFGICYYSGFNNFTKTTWVFTLSDQTYGSVSVTWRAGGRVYAPSSMPHWFWLYLRPWVGLCIMQLLGIKLQWMQINWLPQKLSFLDSPLWTLQITDRTAPSLLSSYSLCLF